MSNYKVVPIPAGITETVRAEMRSPQYGHPAYAEPAQGYGPCRSCLETFEIGQEERILFTYNPFEGLASYPSPGPVFIHGDTCARYESAGFPPALRALPLVVEGFGEQRRLLHQEYVGERDVDLVLSQVLSDERVEYAHLRNAEAGCFIAQVARL